MQPRDRQNELTVCTPEYDSSFQNVPADRTISLSESTVRFQTIQREERSLSVRTELLHHISNYTKTIKLVFVQCSLFYFSVFWAHNL